MEGTHVLKSSTFTIPNNKTITINHYSSNETINTFLASLDDSHLKALLIAYDHLGTTFDLERSIAFVGWLKRQS